MKWYKHQCPFCGRGSIVAVICMLSLFFVPLIQDTPLLACIAIILFVCFVILLSYLILHMLSDEEKMLIEYSEPLEWVNMDDELVQKIREKKKISWLTVVILLGIALVFSFGLADGMKYRSLETPFMFLIDMVLCFLIFFVYYRNKWGKLDCSAEYACPVVDHVKSITEHTKHGKVVHNYAVFYLPDGRYMLKVDTYSASWKLYLIRFNGYYSYVCLSE